jgi:hypothetical protein
MKESAIKMAIVELAVHFPLWSQNYFLPKTKVNFDFKSFLLWEFRNSWDGFWSKSQEILVMCFLTFQPFFIVFDVLERFHNQFYKTRLKTKENMVNLVSCKKNGRLADLGILNTSGRLIEDCNQQ